MNQRIGFLGMMGSGKSEYSKFLAQTFDFTPISLAKPMKDIGRQLAPLFHLDPNNKGAMRPMLQEIGKGPREADPNFWARNMIAQYDLGDTTQGVRYVCDDTRYPNEGLALQAVGFHIIRLEVSEEVRKARILKRDGVVDESIFSHETEVAIAHVAHDEIMVNETEEDMERNFAILAARLSTPNMPPAPEDAYTPAGSEVETDSKDRHIFVRPDPLPIIHG